MCCELERIVPCDIGISLKEREEVIYHLNRLLSDEFVFYAKALKFHWNIKGEFFGPLHALFEKVYARRSEIIDLLAERVQAIGGFPFGTLTEFLKNTRLKEQPGENECEGDMLLELTTDLQTIIKHMREDAQKIDKVDPVTSNLLLSVIEGHEKDAWMLRSHLECIVCEVSLTRDGDHRDGKHVDEKPKKRKTAKK